MFGWFFNQLLHFWSKLVSRYLYSHVLRRHKWSPLSFSIYSPHRYCQPSHDPTQFGIQMHSCPMHDISLFFSTGNKFCSIFLHTKCPIFYQNVHLFSKIYIFPSTWTIIKLKWKIFAFNLVFLYTRVFTAFGCWTLALTSAAQAARYMKSFCRKSCDSRTERFPQTSILHFSPQTRSVASVTNICDKYLWQISVANICDKYQVWIGHMLRFLIKVP